MRAGPLLLAAALAGAGCSRQAPVEAPPPAAARSAVPWTWHPLGGLAVVEGEVAEPTDLVLEGRSVREVRYAEAGPVRWEFFRPPEGETAVLRTGAGRELARFRFAREAPVQTPTTRAAQRPAAEPQTALPRVEAPRIRSQAQAKAAPPAPLPERKSSALPTPAAAAPPPYRTAFLPLPEPLPDRNPPPAPGRAAAPTGAPWPGMGEALNLTRGPGGRKRLLLSFDGGSNAEVAEEILDALRARGVRTTIFLTGAFIQRFPVLVRRMAAEGHELGNHTMNHPHLAPDMRRDPKWTRERVQRELLEADAALMNLLGRPMDPYWRAPYGEHTAEIRRWAEEVGYRHIGWSEGADTLDWATPKERHLYRTGDAILRRLQSRLDRDGDGLIVLMHLGSDRTEGDRPSGGLGAFMDRAARAGWSFVPVSTYLRDLGKPAWDPQHRIARLRSGTPAGAPR